MSIPVLLTSKAQGDVLRERERQEQIEGWTPAHDDAHDQGELARAAAAYALAGSLSDSQRKWITRPYHIANIRQVEDLWPFDVSWWKLKDRRYDLVRAAAMIIAEIERLDRLGFVPEEVAP